MSYMFSLKMKTKNVLYLFVVSAVIFAQSAPAFAAESSVAVDSSTSVSEPSQQSDAAPAASIPDLGLNKSLVDLPLDEIKTDTTQSSTDSSAVKPDKPIKETLKEEVPNANVEDLEKNKTKEKAKDKTDPNSTPIALAAVNAPQPQSFDPRDLPNAKAPKADENTGALTYSYSIVIPPGRNGLDPKLALQYSSQSTDASSAFGYGWSINIPFIERVNKTGFDKLYTDNYFTSSLSGELVNVSGGTYAPKVENGDFLKYSLSSNVWTVTDKSGTTYKFGLTSGSRQDNVSNTANVGKWMLEEVRDMNNNYIKYSYYKDSGQIYPDTITYTGNNVTDGIFTVVFTRSSRSDIITQNKYGFAITTNYKITDIQAKINGAWARKYVLGYTTGDNTQKSLLNTITESGQDESANITTLPAQTFTYQAANSSSPFTNDSNWSTSPETGVIDTQGSIGEIIADINGDGLPDILHSFNGGTGWVKRAYINNGNGTWTNNTNFYAPIEFATSNSPYDLGVRAADVNGDSKADLVQSIEGGGYSFHRVYLNTGSGWSLNANWVPPYEFTNPTYGDTGGRIEDLNGDGLPDVFQVYTNMSGIVSNVYLNTGNGWVQDTGWAFPVDVRNSGVVLVDYNGDGLLDFLKGYRSSLGVDTKIAYKNNGDKTWSSDSSYTPPIIFAVQNNGSAFPDDQGVRMIDIDGDGLVDMLKAYDLGNANQRETYLNKGSGWVSSANLLSPMFFVDGNGQDGGTRYGDFDGDGMVDFYTTGALSGTRLQRHTKLKSDLVSTITNQYGGTTTVTYKGTPQFMNGSTRLNPSLPFVLVTAYQINSDYGFGNPVESDTYTYEGGEFYFNTYLDKSPAGFSKITKVDAAENKVTNFYHQGNTSDSTHGEYSDEMWKIGKPYRVEVSSPAGSLYSKTINKWDSYDLGGGRKFVKLAQVLSQTFDGDSTHKDKAESYSYNNTNGNQTQKVEWGEVLGSDDGTFTDTGTDKFTTDISYASNGASIVGLPSQVTTTDQSANKVKESKLYYDSSALGTVVKGNLTKEERWKTGATYVNTQRTYNATYGTIASSTDERGKVTNYTNDTYNLYPASVTNALNQTTSYAYDYSLGKPKQVTDANTRVYQSVYDGLDRLIEEKQPDLTTPATLVTKNAYTYIDTANAVSVKKSSYLDASTIADSYTYLDGLGRKLQERVEAEGSNFSVKDYAYNNLGLLSKESLPYFSAGSSKTTPTADNTLYITYSYDPMLRVVTTVNNVGTSTNTYSDWKLTVTDQNGKNKDLYKDAYGNLIQVDEHNGASTYTTSYLYNYLGNLTKITDALGNIRNFTYDGLGRRLSAEDLHGTADTSFGSYTYTYDDAGNLTQVVNPNSQTINYTYDDLNRQLTEDYTGQAGTEVTNTYDTGTDGVGRLTSSTNTAAGKSFTYNSLGLVKQEVSTLNTVPYTTTYDYNRQGSQTNITNPDNSQVKYLFNSAGSLDSVQRKESTDASFINVVSNFDYGPHGKVTSQTNANGTSTTNTYDATKLYRVTRKLTTNAGASKLQDLNYTYDANGNITQIVDASNTNSSKTVNYSYDDLNRLLSATASAVASGQSTYTHAFTYNALGNILTRVETIGAGSPVTYTYTYAGNIGSSYANPHAVTSISDGTNTTTYTYDNNGNLTAEGSKTYTWDYNNRMVSAIVPGATPTTTTFAPSSGDGSINYTSSTSWATTHDATTGSSANATATTFVVNSGKGTGSKYKIERSFLPFDTSSLPDGATITDAKLKVYVDSKTNDDNDGDDFVTVVQGSQPSTSTLTTADYDLAGIINSPAEGVATTERKDITNVSTGSYLIFTLNSTGRAWVSTTAATKLALREGHDTINSAFTGANSTANQLTLRSSEYTGTSSDPILEVTYTAPVTVSYGYDSSGQRVKLANGTTTTYYPSKLYNTDGTTPTKHIFAGDADLATVKNTGASASVYTNHTDHLNSTGVVTDSSGNTSELMDYYPFGGLRLDQQTSGYNEQRKYIGQELDSDTQLAYLNARYYNSGIGEFTSQDAVFLALGNPSLVKQLSSQEFAQLLTDPQQLNSYSYSRNNPISMSDPNGHSAQDKVGNFFLKIFVPNESDQVQLGNDAQYLYDNSSAARVAMDHPYATGLAVGIGGAGAAYAGGAAATAVSVNYLGGIGTACLAFCGNGSSQAQNAFNYAVSVFKNPDGSWIGQAGRNTGQRIVDASAKDAKIGFLRATVGYVNQEVTKEGQVIIRTLSDGSKVIYRTVSQSGAQATLQFRSADNKLIQTIKYFENK